MIVRDIGRGGNSGPLSELVFRDVCVISFSCCIFECVATLLSSREVSEKYVAMTELGA